MKAAGLRTRLQLERVRRARDRVELAEILAKLVRPAPGAWLPSRSLARALRLWAGEVPPKRELAGLLAEVGAYPAIRDGRRGWAEVELRPNATRLRDELVRAWNKRLAAEDLPEEPTAIPIEWKTGVTPALRGTPLGQKVEEVTARAIINGHHFDVARRYLWDNPWKPNEAFERLVWMRFALEAQSIRDIAKDVGLEKSRIGAILAKHKARCGLI